MSLVAIVTCAGENVDPDSPAMLAALAAHGVEGELCVWDDPSVRWARFDLVVVRSTWDYPPRREEFLAWARGVPNLENSYEVIAYSSDKHYLADVEAHGIAIIPTNFCAVGERPTLFDGALVVKPCVGAGSMGAERFGGEERARALAHVATLHAQGRDVMIQPYVASVDTIGERGLVFIDGVFSHAMTKGAMLNVGEVDRHALYRRQQMTRAEPDDDAVRRAETILRVMGFADLLYARVDLVLAGDEWQLMELELVEPTLYLGFDEHAGDKLARAVLARLA